MNIKNHIREVPDWPIEGVNFKDITPILQNSSVYRAVVDLLTQPYFNQKIDKVVAIDARGFLLAAPVAYNLNCGLSLVRKKGKLPYNVVEEDYVKEYGMDTVAMHVDTISKGEKVAIIDDLIATGGTLLAATKLVEKLGGEIVGISAIIDLPFLGGSRLLSKYHVKALVKYEKE